MASSKLDSRKRRKLRIRKRVIGTPERPRLTVYRSARHVYAQVIDDVAGTTLVSASTLAKDLRGGLGEGNKTAAAKQVGALVAEQCKSQNITKVVFDRNGYLYHGRVKALADAARSGGLDF
ncbi:MAG: 50S ribosomal protein L18 [Deltaproteobacteria bacterium]|nr:50S ribosomal protein L18 [Deltaproteobacteria bacterium]